LKLVIFEINVGDLSKLIVLVSK